MSRRFDPQGSIWGPFSTVLWGALILALVVITQTAVVFYIVEIRAKFPAANVSPAVLKLLRYNGFVHCWCIFVSTIICGLSVIGIVKLKPGSDVRSYLGLVLPQKKQFFRWFAAVIAFAVLLHGVLVSHAASDNLLRMYSSLRHSWMLWLATVVAGPLFEELFFRGFLVPGLAASALGSVGAVIISSAAWALVHLYSNGAAIIVAFIYGLILGGARVATGSTILTMFFHSLTNSIVIAQVAIRAHNLLA